MSNHYENIVRHLIKKLKLEVMSNVKQTHSLSYYKIAKTPAIILRGFDSKDNKELDVEDKIEIAGITLTGNTVSGSPIITNVSDTSRLTVEDGISGTGIQSGSIILSIGTGSQITLNNNVLATGNEIDLSITFSKIEVYRNYKLKDLDFDLIMATNRSLDMIAYEHKLEKFFIKYGTITVDSQEYDVNIITPFTNNTIPNYSSLKSVSGRFQIAGVKIVGDIYEKIARVKTVDVTMESK